MKTNPMKTNPILSLMLTAIFSVSFFTFSAAQEQSKTKLSDQVENEKSADKAIQNAIVWQLAQQVGKSNLRNSYSTPWNYHNFEIVASESDPHGIGYLNPDKALRSHLLIPKNQGRIVSEIEKGSVAPELGFEVGDIILKINQKEVLHDAEVAKLLIDASSNVAANTKQFPVLVIRKGKKVELSVSTDATSKNQRTYRIGVQVEPVDELIRSHLGLKENEGLAITTVRENSAAEKANLKVHDILVSGNGNSLGDFEALRELVQSSRGTELEFEILASGVRKTLKLSPKLTSVVQNVKAQVLENAYKQLTNRKIRLVLDYDKDGKLAQSLATRFTLNPSNNLKVRERASQALSLSESIVEILLELDELKSKIESLPHEKK